jgi:nicotinate-nucleotide adenylyltransferase
MKNKKLILFGGAFNPPSTAHLNLAKQLLENIKDAEKLLFLPVGDEYNKKDLISSYHRVNMLKLACENEKKIDICTIEVENKKLFTINTLDKVKEIYSNYEVMFLMGTDNLRDVLNWNECYRLLKTYKIIIMNRGQDTLEKVLKDIPELKKYKNNFLQIKGINRTDISSTKIREYITLKKDIKNLTADSVAQYIKKQGLYISGVKSKYFNE